MATDLPPDLILLDIGLPRLDGIKAARAIVQVASAARILFLNENSDSDFESTAARLASGLQGDNFVSSVARNREGQA